MGKRLIIFVFAFIAQFSFGQSYNLESFRTAYAEVYYTAAVQKTLVRADYYYNLYNGTPNECYGFIYKDSSLFTISEGKYLMLGDASVSLDVSSPSDTDTITFSIVVNDMNFARHETQFSFTNKERIQSIGINTILDLQFGDKIKVVGKTNNAGSVLNISGFNTTFIRIK